MEGECMEVALKIDSRKVKPGDTFLALRGVDTDGHQYINKAIENGATKIICEEGSYDVETIVVEDTLTYLIDYLKENYGGEIEKLKLIGITGTNGKTTSAFLLHNALNRVGKKAAYVGTVGFYIEEKIRNLPNTTPNILELYNIFLTCVERGVEYVVLEVSSHGLCRRRVEGLEFDYAVFTNLTQDHLDFHKTMEQYALAKQKLFHMLKPGGTAIVNADDKYKDLYLLPENHNITYGFQEGDYQVIEHHMSHIHTTFTYRHLGEEYDVVSPLLGDYNIYNLLITIVILTELGIDITTLLRVIPTLKAPAGRMETVPYKTNNIIIDYAHTPDAIEKIITTVKPLTKGKIFVVFGCTGDRDRLKRPLMTDLVTRLVDYAIITIDDPHNEDPNQIVDDMIKGLQQSNYEVILDRGKAIARGIELLQENDILLILGKGHEEVIIYKDQRIPFNDRKEVEKYLKEKEMSGANM